jgi:hypothetical protein
VRGWCVFTSRSLLPVRLQLLGNTSPIIVIGFQSSSRGGPLAGILPTEIPPPHGRRCRVLSSMAVVLHVVVAASVKFGTFSSGSISGFSITKFREVSLFQYLDVERLTPLFLVLREYSEAIVGYKCLPDNCSGIDLRAKDLVAIRELEDVEHLDSIWSRCQAMFFVDRVLSTRGVHSRGVAAFT